MFPSQLTVLIWVQHWFIVGFILIQDLSQLLHQRKFHAPSSHCCRVSPLLYQRKFCAASLHEQSNKWTKSRTDSRTNQRSKEEWANRILLSDQKRQVYSHISVGCCIRLKQQCLILLWQVFFLISVGCCIRRKWMFKRLINEDSSTCNLLKVQKFSISWALLRWKNQSKLKTVLPLNSWAHATIKNQSELETVLPLNSWAHATIKNQSELETVLPLNSWAPAMIKKSEQVGNSASTQSCGLCHDKTEQDNRTSLNLEWENEAHSTLSETIEPRSTLSETIEPHSTSSETIEPRSTSSETIEPHSKPIKQGFLKVASLALFSSICAYGTMTVLVQPYQTIAKPKPSLLTTAVNSFHRVNTLYDGTVNCFSTLVQSSEASNETFTYK